jgi:hypothetical protein
MRAEIERGYQAVVNRLSEIFPDTHYLRQLRESPNCSFIQVLERVELSRMARDLGYVGVNDIVHLTETWTMLFVKPLSAEVISKLSGALQVAALAAQSRKRCTMEDGLVKNPKTIYLTNPFGAQAVAHELYHWLNHPHWGIVFEPMTPINEGAAEWLARQGPGDFKNGVYDDVAALIDAYVLPDHSNAPTLMSAYFNGDLAALESILRFAEANLDREQFKIESASVRFQKLADAVPATLAT